MSDPFIFPVPRVEAAVTAALGASEDQRQRAAAAVAADLLDVFQDELLAILTFVHQMQQGEKAHHVELLEQVRHDLLFRWDAYVKQRDAQRAKAAGAP